MSEDLTPTWAPDTCTLPAAEQPLRRAEFDDLFAAAVHLERDHERHARFQLTGGDEVARQMRDLADRETGCCTFFAFTVTQRPGDRVDFEIEVPAGRAEVLDAMVERAERVAARR